jgi:hypothetical protein
MIEATAAKPNAASLNLTHISADTLFPAVFNDIDGLCATDWSCVWCCAAPRHPSQASFGTVFSLMYVPYM